MLNTNLTCWKNGGLNTRIVNEMGNLMFQCNSVKFKIIDNEYIFNIEYNNNNYNILLHKDYPFKSPNRIFFNGIDYKQILSIRELRISNYLKKYYGLDCLCCSSIICINNWIPTSNISHIINDINNTRRIKKEILLRMLCDTIKIKYNCEFLNIVEYLF